MATRRELWSAHLALLGANLFYGGGFTVAKLVMPRLIEPAGFILLRVSVVTLLFWISWTFGPSYRAKIAPRDFRFLALGGLFGVALNQLLFFYGLNLTLPIHAALIMLSTPILITLLAAIALREGLKPARVAGLLLGVSGAAVLISGGKEAAAPDTFVRGDIAILLNAASYAIYLVMIRPLMQRYRPLVVIRWVFLFGLLFVLPFGLPELRNVEWHRFEAGDYAAVAFIVICCTFFTYLWNMYALRYLPPATAGAYIYLQPLFAAIIAVFAYGETITWVKVLAAVLIFSGVYGVTTGFASLRPKAAGKPTNEK